MIQQQSNLVDCGPGGGGGGGLGSLIFSYIRRLGLLFGVQNFEIQYLFIYLLFFFFFGGGGGGGSVK